MDDRTALEKNATALGRGLDCDIAVIGAGVVGLCCALELQAAGHQVLLLDRKGIGAECSFGNAGHIAVEHIFPLASPKTLLDVPRMLLDQNGPLKLRHRYLPTIAPWLARFLWSARPAQVQRTTRTLAAINGYALPAYRQLEDRFGLDGLLKEEGTLVVYEKEKTLNKVPHEQEKLNSFGIETELLSADGLQAFDPALNPALKGGLLFPGSAHVSDPARLTHLLATHFLKQGGQFETQAVQRLTAGHRHLTLDTPRRTFKTRKLVVAAGAWSHQLIRDLGLKLPLETERGYHLMVASPTVQPRLPTTHAERRFVATPMDHGLRLAGRVELGGLSLPPNETHAFDLELHGRAMIPGLKASGYEPWMGFRPTLPDSLPVIGPLPKHPNVICAFGHHHLGLTQAAITGQLVRDLIAGDRPIVDLAPLRATRF